MKRKIIAALLALTVLCVPLTGFAAPTLRQNLENGNIEIIGIENEQGIVVQVLLPGSSPANVKIGDIANTIYVNDTGSRSVQVPIDVSVEGTYTVMINGGSFNARLVSTVEVQNTGRVGELIQKLAQGNAATIETALSDAENRSMLGLDEADYSALTSEGRRALAEHIDSASFGNAEEFLNVYNAVITYCAVMYASSDANAYAAMEKYADVLLTENLLGADDYAHFIETEKREVASKLRGLDPFTKAKFEKQFAAAVFLTKLKNSFGGAEAKPLMEKYKEIFSSKADSYFSRSNTGSIDGLLVGSSYHSLDDFENALQKLVSPNAGNNSSGGSGGGGGNSGGNRSNYGGKTVSVEVGGEPKEENGEVFDDLASVTWAQEAIFVLNKKGIAAGIGDKKYNPNGSVTREEFVKFLTLAFDEVSDTGNLPFRDVMPDSWYEPYVRSGYSKGLIKGSESDMFGVGTQITRQDMAVLTYRYMTHAGILFEFGDVLTFEDKAQISEYALDAVYALSYSGVVKGMEDGTFRPASSSTRAEAAQIIYNAMKYAGRIE